MTISFTFFTAELWPERRTTAAPRRPRRRVISAAMRC
jgi:hypothetical protein